MFEPRLYRGSMNSDRFRFFPTTLHESDLWIGVPPGAYTKQMISASQDELHRLRDVLETHIKTHPEFGTSLEALPWPAEPSESTNSPSELPEEINLMLTCGLQTHTGPMSAVAGLFAEYVGSRLTHEFDLEEVVVENGGDLYLKNSSELVSVIHAGSSPLSDKMAFSIPPGTRGICTSSGTMGHSLSLGRADAVTVIAASTPLADAWATALANQVKGREDVEAVLEKVSGIPEILGCAILAGEQIGVRGEFELKLVT